MEELIKVAMLAIDSVTADSDLCAYYSRICTFAASPQWKVKIAQGIAKAMLESQTANVYEAMEQVESQLASSEDEE